MPPWPRCKFKAADFGVERTICSHAQRTSLFPVSREGWRQTVDRARSVNTDLMSIKRSRQPGTRRSSSQTVAKCSCRRIFYANKESICLFRYDVDSVVAKTLFLNIYVRDAVVYCYLVTDIVWIYWCFVHHVKQEGCFFFVFSCKLYWRKQWSNACNVKEEDINLNKCANYNMCEEMRKWFVGEGCVHALPESWVTHFLRCFHVNEQSKCFHYILDSWAKCQHVLKRTTSRMNGDVSAEETTRQMKCWWQEN